MHEKTITTTVSIPTVNLSDFALFLSVMREKEAYHCVLSIILDEPDLEIMDVHVENVVLNKSGKRAIRLDAWAVDKLKRQFAMEMQNDKDTDYIPKRARFYQSLIDSPILKSGKRTKYKELPTTAIIFITQDDLFGKDLAMYTFIEKCVEVEDLCLEDGTKKIFLNMSSKNGSNVLISLLQYFKTSNLDNPDIIVRDERLEILDSIVAEVKESEEWEELSMNIYQSGIEKGKAQSVIELLEDKGTISEQLRQKIMSEKDEKILSKWLKLAAKSENVEDFENQM